MSENHNYNLVRQFLLLSESHQRALNNCYETTMNFHQNTTNVLLQFMENRRLRELRILPVATDQTRNTTTTTTFDESSNMPYSDRRRRVYQTPSPQIMSRRSILLPPLINRSSNPLNENMELPRPPLPRSPGGTPIPPPEHARLFFHQIPPPPPSRTPSRPPSRIPSRTPSRIPSRIPSRTPSRTPSRPPPRLPSLRPSFLLSSRVPPPPPPLALDNEIPIVDSSSNTLSDDTNETNENITPRRGRNRSNSMIDGIRRGHPTRRYRTRRRATVPFQLPNVVPSPENELIQTSYDSPVRIRPSVRQIRIGTEVIFYSQLSDEIQDVQFRCPIDLLEFSPDDTILRIRHCGHIFREMNLRRHFRRHPRCPICRFDIRDYVDPSNNTMESHIQSTSIRRAHDIISRVNNTLQSVERTRYQLYDTSNNYITPVNPIQRTSQSIHEE